MCKGGDGLETSEQEPGSGQQTASGEQTEGDQTGSDKQLATSDQEPREQRPATGEQETPAGTEGALSTSSEVEGLRAELAEARRREVEAHRRALLAENAGKVVPELIAGSSVEQLDRSVEVARSAFESARAAVLAAVGSLVPAGSPVRQGAGLEGMSPIQKIAYGLKRE